LLYLHNEGGYLFLLGNALGVFEDLALNLGGVAPSVLQLGYALLEPGELLLFLHALVVAVQILLPQRAKKQEIVGNGEHDQYEYPQDEDVAVGAVH
jgi:hypothetical protein